MSEAQQGSADLHQWVCGGASIWAWVLCQNEAAAFAIDMVTGGGFMGQMSVVGLIITCVNGGSGDTARTNEPSAIVGATQSGSGCYFEAHWRQLVTTMITWFDIAEYKRVCSKCSKPFGGLEKYCLPCPNKDM